MKKKGGIILKLLLIGGALYLLSQRVDPQDFKLLAWPASTGVLLLTILLLGLGTVTNLGLDALSWQMVQGLLRPISFGLALRQNMQCQGLAFVTPANSGEIAGRYALQHEKAHKKQSLFLTFWMHLPKICSKIMLSAPLAAYLAVERYQWSPIWLEASLLLALAIGSAYLLTRRILKILARYRLGKWPLHQYIIAGKPSPRQKLSLLAWAGLRFLTYCGQMGLLLWFFSASALPPYFWLSIPAFYLLATVVPSINAFDFAVKGALAVYFFGPILGQEALVIAASTLIWLFNMAIPSIIGLAMLPSAAIGRAMRWKWKS